MRLNLDRGNPKRAGNLSIIQKEKGEPIAVAVGSPFMYCRLSQGGVLLFFDIGQ